MNAEPSFAWTALLVLGGIHGLNPAMGWLFAVSLGLQEENRGAVWQALGPLALGHALAILTAVAVAGLLGQLVPLTQMKWLVAGVLVVFGITHLTRHRHPRWGGMRVGRRDLTIWSFLVASAHGAGLMALPFLMSRDVADASSHAGHGAHHLGQVAVAAGPPPEWWAGLLGSAVHTGAYLLVTGLVAILVYEWLGLRLLRTAWINLDLLWAVALIVTGILTPFL